MSDLNTAFLLDIWHDLKAKRLAPVAVGLVVALIAMPALLLNGSDEGAAVPLPVPLAGPDSGGPEVVVAEELTDGSSKLGAYEARDPFKGLTKAQPSGDSATDGAASAPIDAIPTDGSTGVGDTAGATGGSSIGGSTSPGTSAPDKPADPGTGTTPVPNVPKAPPVKKETAFYNFRLDLKFGKPGREKRIASMSRLSFLYGVGRPIALFLGVDETERRALFLVTPGLNHQGEGKCIPKPTKCDFMSLRVGREHYFSANDLEFHLVLNDITRVKASEDKKERAVARKAAQRRAARVGEGEGSGDAPEPYEWPHLVDSAG